MGNFSNDVELTLPGIDKVWVRNNGQWRDKSELAVKAVEVTVHEPVVEKKSRGWKFWKKRPVSEELYVSDGDSGISELVSQ